VTVLSWENANGFGFTVGEGRLVLLSAEGLEAPPLRLAIAKGAGMNGAISASLRLEPRRIAVEALIDARGLDEAGIAAERTALCRAMRATDACGSLTVTRAGRSRCIEAVPAARLCSRKSAGTSLGSACGSTLSAHAPFSGASSQW
jgi:hypothetical protein